MALAPLVVLQLLSVDSCLVPIAGEFFWVQWSGFEQDPVGDAALADIVKGSGLANQPHQAAVEVEAGGEFGDVRDCDMKPSIMRAASVNGHWQPGRVSG